MGEQTSIDKFMKWLVDDKWDLPNPVCIRTLYTEFSEISGNEKPYEQNMYNNVQSKLKAAKLEEFTIPQIAHIAFLLSIPVDERMRMLIGTCGELVLDPDGHRINFYKSNDGNTWIGTHRKWKGRSKQVAEEVYVVLPKREKWVHEQEEKEKDEEMLEQNLQFQNLVEKAREVQRREEEKEKERLEIMNGELSLVNFAEEMKMKRVDFYGEMDVKQRDFKNFDQVFEEGFPLDFARDQDYYDGNDEAGNPDTHLYPEAVQQLNTDQGEIEYKYSHHQQLSAPNPPMTSVNVQPPVTAISGAQYFQALRIIAFTCQLKEVHAAIDKTAAKVQNQNIHIPITKIVMLFTCILNQIQNCSRKSGQPSGLSITAELYLSSLNSAALTLESIEFKFVIEMIETTKGIVRSKNMKVSNEQIHEDFRTLLGAVGKQV